MLLIDLGAVAVVETRARPDACGPSSELPAGPRGERAAVRCVETSVSRQAGCMISYVLQVLLRNDLTTITTRRPA